MPMVMLSSITEKRNLRSRLLSNETTIAKIKPKRKKNTTKSTKIPPYTGNKVINATCK